MDSASTTQLVFFLIFLIFISAYFSSSETGLFTLNPYRLKHLSKRNSGARKSKLLLSRPDRLMALILLGNNAVNIMAAISAELIFSRIFGTTASFWITTFLLTVIMLVFAEVTPKTYAAVHPEAVAFRSSHILRPLMKLLLPIVVALNWITNGLLRLVKIDPTKLTSSNLNTEELRSIVNDSEGDISHRYQDMLLNVLDLENISIKEIMIPRNEIYGIDLNAPPQKIKKLILDSEYTRIPVYSGNINNIYGILHLRRILSLFTSQQIELSSEVVKRFTGAPYYIPENTSLSKQLINFKKAKQRMGFVINEYGDIQGLTTLDDLLEEIVGDYTTSDNDSDNLITSLGENSNSYSIDATATLREVNKYTGWEIPTEGPKTLNGLVIEYLEAIPDANVAFKINNYYFETQNITKKGVDKVLIKLLKPTTKITTIPQQE